MSVICRFVASEPGGVIAANEGRAGLMLVKQVFDTTTLATTLAEGLVWPLTDKENRERNAAAEMAINTAISLIALRLLADLLLFEGMHFTSAGSGVSLLIDSEAL